MNSYIYDLFKVPSLYKQLWIFVTSFFYMTYRALMAAQVHHLVFLFQGKDYSAIPCIRVVIIVIL